MLLLWYLSQALNSFLNALRLNSILIYGALRAKNLHQSEICTCLLFFGHKTILDPSPEVTH